MYIIIFLICFADAWISTVIMGRQSKAFFTMGTVRKPFSIFDLEFPASPVSAANLLLGIGLLGEEAALKVKRALRGQLYVDFLFMPGVYVGILILCRGAALKTGHWPGTFFCALAYLQLLAWLLDITENLILLSLIKRPRPFSQGQFKAYGFMELFKWGLPLIGFACASSTLLYFWITGSYFV